MAEIPADLRSFLTEHPNFTIEMSEGEVRHVTLYSAGELQTKTFDVATSDYCLQGELPEDFERSYEFEGVDLLKTADGYEPEGVFVWFPKFQAYGSWDCDHHRIVIFPGKTWTEIVKSPTWYFNGQWYPEKIEHQDVKPWLGVSPA